MTDAPDKNIKKDTPVATGPEPGPVSQWLSDQGFEHVVLDSAHVGVEQI